MPQLLPIQKVDNFDKAMSLSTTPQGEFGWTIADTSASGTPTYAAVSGRGMKLTLVSTSEVENVCMYQNDVLPYTLGELVDVEFIAKVAAIDANATVVFGVGSARNDTPDSVSYNAWFRMEGGTSTTAVVCETDDNVTDRDDQATGQTLAATWKKFLIDFSQGLSKVGFYIDGALVKTLDMSGAAATQGVQLMIQLQKTSSASVASITIGRVSVRARLSY